MSDERVRLLLDIEEIQQLKARYWRYIDNKDWDAWRTLFTDDFHFETFGYVWDGADKVVSDISAAAAQAVTVHQGHTGEITITGPDTATGIWAFSDWSAHAPLADEPPTGFHGHGHSHDEYVRTADGWRIRHTVVTRLRVDPLEGGVPTLAAPADEEH